MLFSFPQFTKPRAMKTKWSKSHKIFCSFEKLIKRNDGTTINDEYIIKSQVNKIMNIREY